jgi:hypothetical protein
MAVIKPGGVGCSDDEPAAVQIHLMPYKKIVLSRGYCFERDYNPLALKRITLIL